MVGCHQNNQVDDSVGVLEVLYQQHQQWQGTPYKLGGNDQNGIDCSGFVALTFAENFAVALPRTTHKLAQMDGAVAEADMRPGDLVFFIIPKQDSYYHVGIYLEGYRFLHASTSKGVMISDLNHVYWQKHYWKSLRVLPSS